MSAPPRAVPRDALLAELCSGTGASSQTEPDGEVVLAEPALHALLAPCAATLLAAPGYRATLLFDDALVLRPARAEQLEPLYLSSSYAEE